MNPKRKNEVIMRCVAPWCRMQASVAVTDLTRNLAALSEACAQAASKIEQSFKCKGCHLMPLPASVRSIVGFRKNIDNKSRSGSRLLQVSAQSSF